MGCFDDNHKEFNEYHGLCLSFKFWSHGRLNLFFNPHFRFTLAKQAASLAPVPILT